MHPPHLPRHAAFLVVLILAVVPAAACGSGSESSADTAVATTATATTEAAATNRDSCGHGGHDRSDDRCRVLGVDIESVRSDRHRNTRRNRHR